MTVHKRMSEEQFDKVWGVSHSNATYQSLIASSNAPIDEAQLLQFHEDRIDLKTSKSHVRKLHREMSNGESVLRKYLKERNLLAYDRPLSLNMDFYAMRQIMQQFEQDTNDSSNGWWSSTPLNIILFYQIYRLTEGFEAWTTEGHATTNPPRPPTSAARPPARASSSSKHEYCVYKITNYNEQNDNGQPKCYVGRTKNLSKRMRAHARVSSGCRLIRNAILKYGLCGKDGYYPMHVEPLLIGSETDMKLCETLAITNYNTVAPNGYNMRVGDTMGRDDESSATTTISSLASVHLFETLDVSLSIEAYCGVLRHIQSCVDEEGATDDATQAPRLLQATNDTTCDSRS